MSNRRVEGTYENVEDAMYAVQRLNEEGYGQDDLFIVANPSVLQTIPFTLEAEITTEEGLKEQDVIDDRSFWDKIKDAFTVDEYDAKRYENPDEDFRGDPLYEYRQDLDRGHVILLVNEDAQLTVTADERYTTSADEKLVDTRSNVPEPGMMPTDPDLVIPPDPHLIDDTYRHTDYVRNEDLGASSESNRKPE